MFLYVVGVYELFVTIRATIMYWLFGASLYCYFCELFVTVNAAVRLLYSVALWCFFRLLVAMN